MKTINASKYDLKGFFNLEPMHYHVWMFKEKVPVNQDEAVLCISKAKFIHDRQVYFLKDDGTIELNHKILPKSVLIQN